MLRWFIFAIVSVVFLLIPNADAQTPEEPWNYKYYTSEYGDGNNFQNRYYPTSDIPEVESNEKELRTKIEDFQYTLNAEPTEEERARLLVVHFYGGAESKKFTFYTFTGFDFNYDENNPEVLLQPKGNLKIALESVPGKDKLVYYRFLSNLLKSDIQKQLFSIQLDTHSGSGSLIHTTFFVNCQVRGYFIVAEDAVDESKDIPDSIKDKTIFSCNGHHFYSDKESTLENLEDFKVPFKYFRANDVLATKFEAIFSHKDTYATSASFSKFISDYDGEQTKFALESITSTDKPWYYHIQDHYLKHNFLPGEINVLVNIRTDDNTIIQSHQYSKCKPVDFDVHLKKDEDIVDRAVFSCAGIQVAVPEIHEYPINLPVELPLQESDIAESFRLKFYGGQFQNIVTVENILAFETFSTSGLPDPKGIEGPPPIGFWMDTIAGENMNTLYRYLSYYINPGAKPADVSIDLELVAHDGTPIIIATFNSCLPVAYDPHMQEINGEKHLVDRVGFQCDGVKVDIKDI